MDQSRFPRRKSFFPLPPSSEGSKNEAVIELVVDCCRTYNGRGGDWGGPAAASISILIFFFVENAKSDGRTDRQSVSGAGFMPMTSTVKIWEAARPTLLCRLQIAASKPDECNRVDHIMSRTLLVFVSQFHTRTPDRERGASVARPAGCKQRPIQRS